MCIRPLLVIYFMFSLTAHASSDPYPTPPEVFAIKVVTSNQLCYDNVCHDDPNSEQRKTLSIKLTDCGDDAYGKSCGNWSEPITWTMSDGTGEYSYGVAINHLYNVSDLPHFKPSDYKYQVGVSICWKAAGATGMGYCTDNWRDFNDPKELLSFFMRFNTPTLTNSANRVESTDAYISFAP